MKQNSNVPLLVIVLHQLAVDSPEGARILGLEGTAHESELCRKSLVLPLVLVLLGIEVG